MEAMFLRHEGYLGAIGAFLKGTEELDTDKYSWQENFAGSSSGHLAVSNDHFNDNDGLPDSRGSSDNGRILKINDSLPVTVNNKQLWILYLCLVVLF